MIRFFKKIIGSIVWWFAETFHIKLKHPEIWFEWSSGAIKKEKVDE